MQLKRVNLLKTELNQLSLLKKEQQNQAIKDSALNKGSSGNVTTTIVNNTNNSPVNNNTKTTTLSPLVQVDPVMKAAIGADF